METINTLGRLWVNWALLGLLDTAIVLVVASLVWLAVKRRTSPGLGCWLFLLVSIKLLLPIKMAILPTAFLWTPQSQIQQLLQEPEKQVVTVVANEFFPVAEQPGTRESYQRTDVASGPMVESISSGNATVQPTTHAAIVTTAHQVQTVSLHWSVYPAITWAFVCIVLFARFFRNEWRFRQLLQRAKPATISTESFCRQMGIRRKIAVLESSELTIPVVSGIIRPVIVLPAHIVKTLNNEEIHWVLLHELAHIKRHDLPIALVQRFVAILHFFNPSIWIASSMISKLREYACDDVALLALQSETVHHTGGSALLQIIEHAGTKRTPTNNAIGAFNFKTSIKTRFRRLLDTSRIIRTKLGVGSICVLLLVAAISLPHLTAKQTDTPEPQQNELAVLDDDAANPVVIDKDQFSQESLIPESVTITFVDEQGKRLPGVTLAVRLDRDKSELQSDKNGQVTIDTKAYQRLQRGWFVFVASAPNRITTERRWLQLPEKPVAVPERFTILLGPGITIGGIVRDEQGKPVEGAKIVPTYNTRGDTNETLQFPRALWDGVLSDAHGRWKAEGYSSTYASIQLSVTHPDFLPSISDRETTVYSMKDIAAQNATTVLKRGFAVRGRVTDSEGNPLEGITITFDEPPISNVPSAQQTTDADGQYEIKAWYKKSTRFSVTSIDWAPQFGTLDLNENQYKMLNDTTLNFTLKKGKSIRLKVVDANDNPITQFWVCLSSQNPWLSDVFSTDPQDGVWEWKNAPDQPLLFDVDSIPGCDRIREIKMSPREEPYIVRAISKTVVAGRVVNADTKEPISEFQMIQGQFRTKEAADRENPMWVRMSGMHDSTFTGGRYSVALETRPEPEEGDNRVHFNALRVEAVGYEPDFIVVTLDGKEQTHNFELKPAQAIEVKANILLPNGEPARNADVALGGLSGIPVRINGDGRIVGNTGNPVRQADVYGHFTFPTPGVPYVIVAVHPEGFVRATQEEVETGTIRMQPWCRIEGTVVNGKTPAPDISLSGWLDFLYTGNERIERRLTVTGELQATSDAKGNFVFERVVPGLSGYIGREQRYGGPDKERDHCGMTFLNATHFDTKSGETLVVQIGQKGRLIKGQLVQPADAEQIPWKYTLLCLCRMIEQGDMAGQMEYTVGAIPDDDGSFQIPDVPPGKYRIVDLSARPPKDRKDSAERDDYRYRSNVAVFEVPELSETDADEPLDVGIIPVEFEKNLSL